MTDIRETATENLRKCTWWGGAGQALPEMYVEQLITEIDRLNQKLVMTEISLDHKTTLLDSCEKALADRDEKILQRPPISAIKADTLEKFKYKAENHTFGYQEGFGYMAGVRAVINMVEREAAALREEKS